VTGHEVATSFDGKLAYVPIYRDSSVGDAGSDGRELVVIDIGLWQGRPALRFRARRPPPLCGDESQRRSALCHNRVGPHRHDHRSENTELVGTIPTGQDESHMLVLSHDGRFGYTANVEPGTVSVLDLKARKLISVIPVSQKNAAYLHLCRRSNGFHRRPDEAAFSGDRHRHEQVKEVDSFERFRIWHRHYTRWTVDLGGPAE